ncbi:hypothetical protein SPI_05407 [Niveomyces insectorum RCEF 264]|uniref:Uncharacterized protein n=1 Tax=Niveomyces insectorum RCEF 264 TaxID=1081102 RepID=A0A167T6V2_9HYPO|nr:hypothetical protein SPI_05407 [Niveomyces insectorum RCEF 264]
MPGQLGFVFARPESAAAWHSEVPLFTVDPHHANILWLRIRPQPAEASPPGPPVGTPEETAREGEEVAGTDDTEVNAPEGVARIAPFGAATNGVMEHEAPRNAALAVDTETTTVEATNGTGGRVSRKRPAKVGHVETTRNLASADAVMGSIGAAASKETDLRRSTRHIDDNISGRRYEDDNPDNRYWDVRDGRYGDDYYDAYYGDDGEEYNRDEDDRYKNDRYDRYDRRGVGISQSARR